MPPLATPVTAVQPGFVNGRPKRPTEGGGCGRGVWRFFLFIRVSTWNFLLIKIMSLSGVGYVYSDIIPIPYPLFYCLYKAPINGGGGGHGPFYPP